jgi:hypothetical protein
MASDFENGEVCRASKELAAEILRKANGAEVNGNCNIKGSWQECPPPPRLKPSQKRRVTRR